MDIAAARRMKSIVLAVCMLCLGTATADVSISKDPKFEIKNHFSLQCNTTTPRENHTTVWLKEDKPVVEQGRYKIVDDKKTGVSTLQISHSDKEDAGNYSCKVLDGDEVKLLTVTVTSKVYVRVPQNLNAVEGEKLRIVCEVAGNPRPQLSWTYKGDNQTDSLIEPSERISFEEHENVADGALVITNVTLEDKGIYTCVGKAGHDQQITASCTVRVKGKYAALWPFLGIVAEVVILCAIIFVYEKKHNKADMDESDTDQSPDQKNTPDHGKGSNLRHRQ